MKHAATTIVLSLTCLGAACALSACGSEEPTQTQTQTTPATNVSPQPENKPQSPYSGDPAGG